ncbi:NADP-dependent oxidoreductase [Actinoplanes sp. NPDC049316]|uniref:NADP-dependent oxidoreductase n=1 Tax=Actinoplanes sp. NPDC049316 TaxID=3154727 RepID=UPI003431D6A5
MRAIEMIAYGGPEVLRPATRRTPTPTDGVRVLVEARPVNPIDLHIRRGSLAAVLPELPFPVVPGWDFAGVLLDDAGTLPAGQRVAGYVPWLTQGGDRGTYADIVVADPAWFAAVPDGVGIQEASTLPMNGLTAAQCLDILQLGPGDSVLVTGASGAVGGFTAQLAVRRGARVAALASHGDEEHVAALGVHEVIPRSEPAQVVAAARRLAPGGIDALLDAALLGTEVLPAVRDHGRYLGLVESAAPPTERGIEVLTMWTRPDAGTLGTLLAAMGHGELTTRIARRMPLTRAATAHRLAEAGGTRGAIVLTS